jgi:hypothetical protein
MIFMGDQKDAFNGRGRYPDAGGLESLKHL